MMNLELLRATHGEAVSDINNDQVHMALVAPDRGDDIDGLGGGDSHDDINSLIRSTPSTDPTTYT